MLHNLFVLGVFALDVYPALLWRRLGRRLDRALPEKSFLQGARPARHDIFRWLGAHVPPPLYNVVLSFFQMHITNDFLPYQIACVLLNTVVFMGAYAAFHALGGARSKNVGFGMLALTLLLCANPSLIQNVTYVWTRALANFFIVCSLVLFILSERQNDPSLRRMAYLHMAIGALAHYSAFPYLVALVAADFFLSVKKDWKILEPAKNMAIFSTFFAPWVIFALVKFGAQATFGANSTVIDSSSMGPCQNVVKIFTNTVNTFVPHPLRGAFDGTTFFLDLNGTPTSHTSPLFYLREYFFLIYQTNFLFMLGYSDGWSQCGYWSGGAGMQRGISTML